MLVPLRELDEVAFLLARLAVAAGPEVMRFYSRECITHIKPDSSPVTEADLAAEHQLVTQLATELPGVRIISEEHVPPRELDHYGTTSTG